MGQSGEDPAGCAAGRFHSASHDCNQGQISLQIYKIRLNRTVDSGYHRLLIVHELILMHKIVMVSMPEGMCSNEIPYLFKTSSTFLPKPISEFIMAFSIFMEQNPFYLQYP